MFRFVQIIYSNLILQIFQLTIAKAIKIIVWNLFEHKNIFLFNWKFETTSSFLCWESKEARKDSFKSIEIVCYFWKWRKVLKLFYFVKFKELKSTEFSSLKVFQSFDLKKGMSKLFCYKKTCPFKLL